MTLRLWMNNKVVGRTKPGEPEVSIGLLCAAVWKELNYISVLYLCYYSCHITFCSTLLLWLFNCTDTIQVTDDHKYLPGGQHDGQPRSRRRCNVLSLGVAKGGWVPWTQLSQILIFCWPCISIYLFINIDQLDALNFIISLFQASTCFEHMCSSSGGQNVLYSLWYHQTYKCDDTRYCIIQFLLSWRWAHVVETCSGLKQTYYKI